MCGHCCVIDQERMRILSACKHLTCPCLARSVLQSGPLRTGMRHSAPLRTTLDHSEPLKTIRDHPGPLGTK
eukprot:364615-Chlamydomonas_euryale.AAC.40